jgi:hypothetical protein
MEQSEDWLTGHRYLNMDVLEEKIINLVQPHELHELEMVAT